jgi:hypothetical protein
MSSWMAYRHLPPSDEDFLTAMHRHEAPLH